MTKGLSAEEVAELRAVIDRWLGGPITHRGVSEIADTLKRLQTPKPREWTLELCQGSVIGERDRSQLPSAGSEYVRVREVTE